RTPRRSVEMRTTGVVLTSWLSVNGMASRISPGLEVAKTTATRAIRSERMRAKRMGEEVGERRGAGGTQETGKSPFVARAGRRRPGARIGPASWERTPGRAAGGGSRRWKTKG